MAPRGTARDGAVRYELDGRESYQGGRKLILHFGTWDGVGTLKHGRGIRKGASERVHGDRHSFGISCTDMMIDSFFFMLQRLHIYQAVFFVLFLFRVSGFFFCLEP